MMDRVHFILAFDKAIERVRKYSGTFNPFLDLDCQEMGGEEVYFNSDEEEAPVALINK